MKKKIQDLLIPVTTTLIDQTPNLFKKMNENKGDSFFDKNKSWIFTIILTIFVTRLGYIHLFENNILNSIINISWGFILLMLICLFLNECKKIFKINSNFLKFLVIVIIILGFLNSIYHVSYAIFNLF